MDKPAISSKTLWANGILGVASLLTIFAGSGYVVAHPQIAAGIAFAITALNFGLRFVTNTGISMSGD